MGSGAVVVVCRDEHVAQRRFGVADSHAAGVVVTRTGRPFFADGAQEHALLAKVRAGLDQTGLWAGLGTDWLLLDCELLPWSAKAEELLRRQYASVAAAATATLDAEVAVLSAAAARGAEVGDLLARTTDRKGMTAGFVNAYRRYCWPVHTVDDLRLAPFQVLVGEGKVHALSDHLWHLDVLGRLCEADPNTFRGTPSVTVDRMRGGCGRVVGGADGRRRRGHGRQTGRRRPPRPQGAHPARHQVPRP